jgi:hypothetical protein
MEHEMRHRNSRVSNDICDAPLSVEYTFSGGGYAKNATVGAMGQAASLEVLPLAAAASLSGRLPSGQLQ